MRWADVDRIEVGGQGAIVLHSQAGRFVFPPPLYWSGTQKSEALAFVEEMFDKLGVPRSVTAAADFKAHHRVRIRSDAPT